MKRDNSILQKDLTKCFVCGTCVNIHKHEIYYGSDNRKKSIQHGFYVALCGEHHNLSNKGVHFNKTLDKVLKRACQSEYEKTHSREEFVKIIGRNYLDD